MKGGKPWQGHGLMCRDEDWAGVGEILRKVNNHRGRQRLLRRLDSPLIGLMTKAALDLRHRLYLLQTKLAFRRAFMKVDAAAVRNLGHFPNSQVISVRIRT